MNTIMMMYRCTYISETKPYIYREKCIYDCIFLYTLKCICFSSVRVRI